MLRINKETWQLPGSTMQTNTYDSVPLSWLLRVLEIYKGASTIAIFFRESIVQLERNA